MDGLLVVEVGTLPARIAAELARFLSHSLGIECTVSTKILDPTPAYDARRNQFDARALLDRLAATDRPPGHAVLGVADVDLGSPVFTFVFGEAKHGGHAAVVSLHRLRPEGYGLPADPHLLSARARRVTLHETGHLSGLLHCREPDCVMRFSGVAEELDLLREELCLSCREALAAGGAHGISDAPPSGEERLVSLGRKAKKRWSFRLRRSSPREG